MWLTPVFEPRLKRRASLENCETFGAVTAYQMWMVMQEAAIVLCGKKRRGVQGLFSFTLGGPSEDNPRESQMKRMPNVRPRGLCSSTPRTVIVGL